MRLSRFLITIKVKIYSNNIIFYKLYSYFLRKYEKEFDKNNYKTLKNMVKLYIKLNDTYFHDLADGIELWIDHYGDKKILKYIQNKKNNRLNILEEIIKSKLK